MESLERREPISLLEILEEQNPNAERAARSTKVSLRKVGTREEKGMGAWAAPREDELGKVIYKSEDVQRTKGFVSYFDPSDHPPTSLHCKVVMVPKSTLYRVVPCRLRLLV